MIEERIVSIKKNKSWKSEFWEYRYLILVSILLSFMAFILSYLAGNYVRNVRGVSVPDLILDSIPTVNLSFIYSYVAILIFAVLFLYPLIFEVKKLHQIICLTSFLYMVRAAFMIFTHLTLPGNALNISLPDALFFLDFKNDLFFSGHTALPFLGFLFFKSKIRYFFLFASIIMAVSVLLMHIHYSIDVLSAFFITYGVYKLGDSFFRRIEESK